MPRAVAGDDEKKAKRACGAAAINACLKSKRSRLIIAKTKDRKHGELYVLADAKQYKKALSEETGFDFDDKRYPKYHKETLEEMGYVIRNVNNSPNIPATAKVWSERRDEYARGIYLSPGQAPPWKDYDLLGYSKVKDLLQQIKLDDSNKITIVKDHYNYIKPLEQVAQCEGEYVDYKHQVNVYLNLIGDTKIFMFMNASNLSLPGDLLIAVPQPIFDQEEEYIFECAQDNQTHDYFKSTIGLCFALTNKDGKLQYCKFCLHKKCIKKQVRQLDWLSCDERYELAMKNIYFKPRDLKTLFRARRMDADNRKRDVNRMVEQMETRHNDAEITYFLSGPEVYLGEPIKPKDYDQVEHEFSTTKFQWENRKMPTQQLLAKIREFKQARQGKAKSLIYLSNTQIWKPFSNKYVFYKWRKITINAWITYCHKNVRYLKIEYMKRMHLIPLLNAPWTNGAWMHVCALFELDIAEFKKKINNEDDSEEREEHDEYDSSSISSDDLM